MAPPVTADTRCGLFCTPNPISNQGAMQWLGGLEGEVTVEPTFRACPERSEWVGRSKEFEMPISRKDRDKFRSDLQNRDATQIPHLA